MAAGARRAIGRRGVHARRERVLRVRTNVLWWSAIPGNSARASFKTFESKSTKADVQKHLKEGFAYAKQTIEGLDPAAITGTKKMFGGDHTIIETSFVMTDDLHEHLGQLIAYARMNGVVPPWSK